MRQLSASSDEHAIMNDIADETGGKAFYGTNDLRAAMQRSMEEGSSYYTLTYSPQNQNWNAKFRRIEVKLLRSGYHLQYRRGWFGTRMGKTSVTPRKLSKAM
jgi:VWFA-related protein